MARTLFATLIGINDYKERPLNGCVPDALKMDVFLRDLCKQQKKEGEATLLYSPCYLLAPNESDFDLHLPGHRTMMKSESVPFPEKDEDIERPTFKNISTKAFEHLKQAKDGDICLLYYSGHGGRVPAPNEFKHTKSDGMNETLVCYGQHEGRRRDLIDKELAYLLWDALEGKNVHCLLIMDCCHSGNNTRADDPNVRSRNGGAMWNEIPFEQYLGYDKGFYEISNGKADVKIANYVHLAAAQDNEEALEMDSNGLFTTKLLEALDAGGSGRTYRDLMRTVTVGVRNRRTDQNPVAFSGADSELDRPFMGGDIIPYQPRFEVYLHSIDPEEWRSAGGAMHGLQPGSEIRIEGIQGNIKLIDVKANYAILDNTKTGTLSKEKQYEATLARVGRPSLRMKISEGLSNNNILVEKLRQAYSEESHPYLIIDFDPKAASDYVIKITEQDEFVLTRYDTNAPLFKRELNANVFLRSTDVVAKWLHTVDLKSSSGFSLEDFVFTVEVIEGIGLNLENLDKVTATGVHTGALPDVINIGYKQNRQPAIRLKAAINRESNLEECYIGALYLQSMFGIRTDLIPVGGKLTKNGEVTLGYVESGKRYKTIPFMVDEQKSESTEATGYFKIVVSDKLVDLQTFKQNSLEYDKDPSKNFRGDDMGLENTKSDTTWSVFTTKVRITGRSKEKMLDAGVTDFPAFTIEAPNGFTAKAFAATADDLLHKLPMGGTKSIKADIPLIKTIQPPADLFGDAATDDPFPTGLNSASANGVQALELCPAKEGDPLPVLAEGQQLVIRPKTIAATTRSVDDSNWDAAIVPYGYNQEDDLYFPIGFSDDQGNVYITQLPPESEGLLQGSGEITRGIGGSIKLYFKKIFRRKRLEKVNTLELYRVSDWQSLGKNPVEMKAALGQKPNGRAVLLIHGIIGDTGHMLEAFKSMPDLASVADFVLTYDYENLATDVSDTGKALGDALAEAGFGAPGTPELVIVAHSMGGLVSRFLIEEHSDTVSVKRLIMVGVPNAGSELPVLVKSAFGILVHALNATGPLKYAASGLSFLLKKLQLDPGNALSGLQPGSKSLQKLQTSKPPVNVPYHTIAGDITKWQTENYEGGDRFLEKVAAKIKEAVLYPTLNTFVYDNKPNDMAVTHASMHAYQGFDPASSQSVASDHLAYFRERKCQEELKRLIVGQ